MKNNTFKLIENGKEVLFYVIRIVKYKDNNYIIYKDKNNELYASKYNIINNELEIDDINDEEVYNYLDSIIVGEKISE